MLTLKLISEQTERVIAGLEKKHFKGAREAIEEVMAVDKRRRETQQTLDNNLSEAKKMAAQIGQLMKQGKRDEAEQIKATVAQMKETNKKLEADKAAAEDELTTLLAGNIFLAKLLLLLILYIAQHEDEVFLLAGLQRYLYIMRGNGAPTMSQ